MYSDVFKWLLTVVKSSYQLFIANNIHLCDDIIYYILRFQYLCFDACICIDISASAACDYGYLCFCLFLRLDIYLFRSFHIYSVLWSCTVLHYVLLRHCSSRHPEMHRILSFQYLLYLVLIEKMSNMCVPSQASSTALQHRFASIRFTN